LAGSVEFGPGADCSDEFGATYSCASSLQSGNDEITFGSAFDLKIAVELAELEKLIFVHVNYWTGVHD
jgi:hypothetical protein